MSQQEDKNTGAALFWGIVAVGAVSVGFLVAIVAGYVLGHYTHTRTKTVAVRTVTVGTKPSSTTASTSSTATTAPLTAADIPLAPAFSAADIGQQAQEDWLTNGGGYSNDRFSPLTQISDQNVSQLKGKWITHLKSGLANKYSAEGQPLEYQGVLYVTTGADDVFAVDVTTGKQLWKYEAKMPDNLASYICCGWDSRGVALGDGKVYSPGLDGTLTALDQRTGKLLWKSRVGSPKSGYTITASPLYYDGLVYTSPSGGEYGNRGFLDAYDAKTGKRVWRTYTVPKPGEPGSETWPKNDEWKHGGANIWNTPSVDPSLGMLYFSTSNTGSDFDGRRRAGDNLFSASIIALDAKTGAMKWHYQQVHHDIWDYDSTSPTVLIDAKINGQDRKGIAEPSKTGYAYFLDRATGKPIFPIVETPVAQSKEMATAKTQPIPQMPAFSQQTVDAAQLKAIKAGVKGQLKKGEKMPTITPGKLYDVGVTSGNKVEAVAPSVAGGNNWPPSSYNPDNQTYYVCAQNGAQAFFLQKKAQKFKKGTTYTGSVRASGITGFDSPGTLTAYDMTTGKIKWQNKFPDACYSGAVSTAGNLVFVGRNKGDLEAYNGTTGKKLWGFQTGAGANSTATVFSHQGREYISFLAGGNALNGSSKGDNLWLFSLDGTLGPAAAAGEGTAIEHAGEPATQDATQTSKGDAAAGKSVFADNCAGCHGAIGHGGNGGPDLSSIDDAGDLTKVVKQVKGGGGGMPAFSGQLSAKQIADVATFVTTKVHPGK
jgi:quinohemoprotein ethanol dehydrogenase